MIGSATSGTAGGWICRFQSERPLSSLRRPLDLSRGCASNIKVLTNSGGERGLTIRHLTKAPPTIATCKPRTRQAVTPRLVNHSENFTRPVFFNLRHG